MPVINKPETSMALLPQSTSSLPKTEGTPPNEMVAPRSTSTSLQGLLRFCMETTKGEDALQGSELQPMDEEVRNCMYVCQCLNNKYFYFIEEDVFGKCFKIYDYRCCRRVTKTNRNSQKSS